jgi:hypothetical protein
LLEETDPLGSKLDRPYRDDRRPLELLLTRRYSTSVSKPPVACSEQPASSGTGQRSGVDATEIAAAGNLADLIKGLV